LRAYVRKVLHGQIDALLEGARIGNPARRRH
jgi:hypothetical protein